MKSASKIDGVGREESLVFLWRYNLNGDLCIIEVFDGGPIDAAQLSLSNVAKNSVGILSN
jgi:hypothetical protein